MTRRVLLSVLTLALTLTLAAAGDWPRFRGPNGTGTADGELPPIDPKAPLWKVEVPGKGVSSPIVVGGKVFLQSGSDDGKKRFMLCLDAANGKTLWTKEVPGRNVPNGKGPAGKHPKNSLASGTPACDGERVYGVFWDGDGLSLHAYEVGGKELWHQEMGPYRSDHGSGQSPVVYNGIVYVNKDGGVPEGGDAVLLAYDAKTGEKKWKADRKPYRACYSTPSLLERPGKPAELLVGTTTAVTAYEPATGKVVWEYPIKWPDGKMPLRVIGSPVYVSGLVVCYCGDGGGARYAVAIDPEANTPTKVWELSKDIPYVPCMLTKGDNLFWVTDKPGLACAADAKTGTMLFTERVFAKEVTASPILVGDKVLAIGEDGQVVVFKAEKKLEVVTDVKLGEGVFASPAFADGKLYVRGTTHLFCFGKK